MRHPDSRWIAALLALLAISCGSGGAAPDAAAVPATPTGPSPAAGGAGTVPAAAVDGAAAGRPASGQHPSIQVRFDRIQSKRAEDKPIIRKGVRPHVPEVRTCYQRGLAKAPDLRGQLEVALAISKAGRVARARVRSSTLSDRATAQCVVRAARRWSFRGATKRIDAVVRFKFYRAR